MRTPNLGGLRGRIARFGFRGYGKSFPDGSKIVKLRWKPKKSTEASFEIQRDVKVGRANARNAGPYARSLSDFAQPCTSGHPPSLSGLKASSAGMAARILT